MFFIEKSLVMLLYKIITFIRLKFITNLQNILMSGSELNKTLGQQSGNAKNHLDSVILHSKQTRQLHERFSQDLQLLNKEMLVLRQKVKNNPMQLKKFLKEKLKPLENELLVGEESQKNENKLNQQIITEIKRQNKETSESIIRAFQKLKQLEVKVGRYQ